MKGELHPTLRRTAYEAEILAHMVILVSGVGDFQA